jgi:hypothetical protein
MATCPLLLGARHYAFGTLALDEVVSFTSATNLRSQHVMQKLGMHHDPVDDFEHPSPPRAIASAVTSSIGPYGHLSGDVQDGIPETFAGRAQ